MTCNGVKERSASKSHCCPGNTGTARLNQFLRKRARSRAGAPRAMMAMLGRATGVQWGGSGARSRTVSSGCASARGRPPSTAWTAPTLPVTEFSEPRCYWAGKPGQHDRLRRRFARTHPSVTDPLWHRPPTFVRPPWLRANSSLFDSRRVRFDDGFSS